MHRYVNPNQPAITEVKKPPADWLIVTHYPRFMGCEAVEGAINAGKVVFAGPVNTEAGGPTTSKRQQRLVEVLGGWGSCGQAGSSEADQVSRVKLVESRQGVVSTFSAPDGLYEVERQLH